ncbi:enoyl-CoA hydratase/isomerase family protein [Nocardioides sp. YIM 152588]|uniref:enoyl-CoA hydratase/isomerase family protein n=1 Tax=Nocardioides sp. YIM 152588 TaxID=3158259 RepID=UPI0032E375BB
MRITDLRTLACGVGRSTLAAELGVLGTGEPLVLAPEEWPPEPEAVARAVGDLPTVVVLLADPDRVPASAAPLLAAADVCLSTRADPPAPWVHADPEALAAVVAAQPLACHALVALTRVSQRLAPAEAIWAESATYSTLLGSNAYRDWLAARPAPRERPEPEHAAEVRHHEGLVRIRLNRPHVRNAIDSRMRDDLVAALELLEVAPEVEAELSGAGACFSAGGDLSEFGRVDDPATAHAVRATRHPALALSRVADRVTARVHGPSVGAGVELAAFARRVLAAPDATFRLPEVAMGLIPGAGGTCSLVRRLGRHRANWLMLTGATLDAVTARDWGLVDALDGPPAVAPRVPVAGARA